MEIKTETSFMKSTKCADVYSESHVDYSLPDYLGDVRKILFTEASLRPSGRFAGGDEVEFSGIVVYNVVYSDEEGRLCSTEFTSDYDYTVKCSAESYRDSLSETKISGYSIRLISPRRISAKTSLVGSVRLCEEASVSVLGNAFADHSPEINTKNIQVRSSQLSSVSEREYAEEIAKLEGAIADEIKVIYSTSDVVVDSIEHSDDSVILKGKIKMAAVIQNADAPAYRIEKSIPLEESLNFSEVNNETKLIPEITVTSLKSNVNADEDGCTVVLSIICEMCVLGEQNTSAEIITDAYLKNCQTENLYADYNYTSLVDIKTVKGSHNAEIDRSDIESDNLHEIIFLTATPSVERIDRDGDVANILGEIRYSGVASEIVDDKICYIPLKFSSPFAVNVNTSCQNDEKTQLEVKILANSASATLDANKLYASCFMDTRVVISENKKTKVLTSSAKKEGGEIEKTGAKVTVYYPSSDETLFSVAKRFRTSGQKLASDNEITEAVFASDNPDGMLTGVKKLIIY